MLEVEITMKIAVCDNDQYELGIIRELLDNYEASSNISFTVKYYNSSVELASIAGFEKFDIYFLDIIMPVMNGLALANEIRTFDKAAPIIFLTSSSEFAVDSYEVKAFNYLLKPVNKERLYTTLDDLIDFFNIEQTNNIIIKNNSGIHKIRTADIVYAEALNRKVTIHLKNGEHITSTDVFSSICDTLSIHKEFMLPHRSYIVNMNYISTIISNEIHLSNNKTVPLAQRRVVEIKKQYLTFQMEE